MRAMARPSDAEKQVLSGAAASRDDAKSKVLAAIGALVDGGRAEWSRSASGEIELRLSTGEVFVLGAVSVTRVG
ncbi:hypothetical protein EN829_020385 [Mesorhizobium sp. M00.F.Ca.ET.186.01.1.1]|nr:hypothetical protein EN848_28970 [bacterium M00.F.Ca.ET.205.01.1.1]TGU50381.1 hypothetical protein EN795_22430 [bacterium M00.F.Ca.ET.152.01.1.1]TGV33856.1 hypothetical protein EN829_020385 [Mesorhizobium sp. M00.F.Ca.ET.186.01.1.1]TGZ40745.1 hypothetical protein EN805_21825 [bacterium M00.F.Ca.ET.162.01.1.1]